MRDANFNFVEPNADGHGPQQHTLNYDVLGRMMNDRVMPLDNIYYGVAR